MMVGGDIDEGIVRYRKSDNLAKQLPLRHQVRAGRRKPYTELGIRRCSCVRCGSPARFQWNACADGNMWRPLCLDCDIKLNKLVLEWVGDPHAAAKIDRYSKIKRGS